MSLFHITTARPDDGAALFTLQRAAFVDEAVLYGTPDVPALTETRPAFETRLTGSITLVATLAGRIVGAVCAVPRTPYPEIERLMVAPDCRRRGIASTLMAEIEKRLAADGHKRARLIVGEIATANRRLYERLGYAVIERSFIFGDIGIFLLDKPLA